MNEHDYQLTIIIGGSTSSRYPIMQSLITIGRDPACDLTINDAEVSRRHATLREEAGLFILEDQGSTNGTQVGGKKIAGPHYLSVGDVIQMGQNVTLTFLELTLDENAGVKKEVSPEPPQVSIPPVGVHPALEPEQVKARKSEPWDTGRKSSSKLTWILAIAVLLVACVCGAIFFWYIDRNLLWCVLLPFLPACP